MTILVTGGAGFIGVNFIRHLLKTTNETIINLDKLTYAGNLLSLEDVLHHERFKMVHGDILDSQLFSQLLNEHTPSSIVHFAAESHVDRSIYSPEDFIQTNVVGTFRLLDTSRKWWLTLDKTSKESFRFLHVSTDEVYGSLSASDPAFTEDSPYQPNNPYSASKASSDHLVRSYFHTYGFPVLTTNCSNNYGPYQFPEKLIPLMIHRAINGEDLPVYGDGQNIRDWLNVEDHCTAILKVIKGGKIGDTYNIGGDSEMKNLDVVHILCDILDELAPKQDKLSYRSQIKFVTDRPGHDRRYAINCQKIKNELGWSPSQDLMSGLRKTVAWYLENHSWVQAIAKGKNL